MGWGGCLFHHTVPLPFVFFWPASRGSVLCVCRSDEVGKSGSACSKHTLSAAAAVSRRFWRLAHTLLSTASHILLTAPSLRSSSLTPLLPVCLCLSLPPFLSPSPSLSLPLFLLLLRSGCSSLLFHSLSLHLSKCWRNTELRQRKLRRTEERSEKRDRKKSILKRKRERRVQICGVWGDRERERERQCRHFSRFHFVYFLFFLFCRAGMSWPHNRCWFMDQECACMPWCECVLEKDMVMRSWRHHFFCIPTHRAAE